MGVDVFQIELGREKLLHDVPNLLQRKYLLLKHFSNYIIRGQFPDLCQILLQMEALSLKHILMKQLIISLKEEYDSMNYDINGSLRTVLQVLMTDQINQTVNEKQMDHIAICQQLPIFLSSFGTCPAFWVELLNNESFTSEYSSITINSTLFFSRIFAKLISDVNSVLSTKDKKFNFQEEYFNEENKKLLSQLFDSVAYQISKRYATYKVEVQDRINEINFYLEKSKIVNSYLVFELLREFQVEMVQKMEDQLGQGMLRHCPEDKRKLFSIFTLKNYENAVLKFDDFVSPLILTEEEKQTIYKEKLAKVISRIEKEECEIHLAKNQKGNLGIYLKYSHDQECSILKISEDGFLEQVYLPVIQCKWEIYQKTWPIQKIQKILLQKEIFIEENDKITEEIINAKGVLGKFLASIHQYESLNEFFQDLSKRAILTGSMEIIVKSIPIFNFLFIAGGFTYTFYHIFNNSTTNKKKKIKQFGHASLKAASSIGSAISGAVIGQSFIPIPVVGAFVGGVIGGVLGEKGGEKIVSKLEVRQFYGIIDFLEKTIQNERYWKYSQKMLNQLGINKGQFKKTNPVKKSKGDQWITAICFCLVCFYESKKLVSFTQKKIKECEEKKIEETVEEENYVNRFQTLKIGEYLQNKIKLITVLSDLEQMTSPILQNIFDEKIE